MKKIKIITLLLLFISFINISCEEQTEDDNKEVNDITLDEIIGEWKSGESFMVFGRDNTYILYFRFSGVIQAGHYSYNKDTKTITANNSFNNTPTTIKVRKISDKYDFETEYYSQISNKYVGDSYATYRKGKKEIYTAFCISILNLKTVVWDEYFPYASGPDRVTTEKKVEYYFVFKNNYIGSFTRHIWYPKYYGKDEYNGFDFYYIFWDNKLYYIGYSNDYMYSSPYQNHTRNSLVKIVPLIVDSSGRISKWDKKEIKTYTEEGWDSN